MYICKHMHLHHHRRITNFDYYCVYRCVCWYGNRRRHTCVWNCGNCGYQTLVV